jgi:hypothetical protein
MPAATSATAPTCRVSHSGRITLKKGERRRLSLSFEEFDEIEGGDTLAGAPAVTLEVGSGVLVSGEGVLSPVAFFVADALAAVAGDWSAEVAVMTAGGWRLVRTFSLRIEG